MKSRILIWGIGVLLILVLAWFAVQMTWRVGDIRGTVTSDDQPLAGATVRVKTTDFETTTDSRGNFTLTGLPRCFSVHLTAWQDGYYIGGQMVFPWQRQIDIALAPYSTEDNPDYAWMAPQVNGRSLIEEFLARVGLPVAAGISFERLFLPLSVSLPLGCADCHGETIFQEYAADAHARGADNVIFRTVYDGTDVNGHTSPPTRYGFSRDYGRFPLPPDSSQPWYGPGFKLDFPDQAGNCADCHEPAVALNAPHDTDIDKIPADALRGTHCDFCHKIADVKLDAETGLPGENMPGVLSMEFRRPDGEAQVFFGPYDDVDVGPDSYLPLQNESAACAACHNASFWGTPIYQSYAEWLTSPYPAEGTTCQTCHMTPNGVTDNFAPGRGGQDRDAEQVFSHTFPGAADLNLLQHTAKLEVSAARNGESISIEVRVTNENGGHDIPTDSPLRNIILLVDATDSAGALLEYTLNQTVPDWGGAGSGSGNYAGRPGKGYAKVLQELWTEVSPTIAYWRQTTIVSDNRLRARETDVSNYEFKTQGSGPVTVTAKLIFRRAFIDFSEQKGWDVPDILMNQVSITVQ